MAGKRFELIWFPQSMALIFLPLIRNKTTSSRDSSINGLMNEKRKNVFKDEKENH